MVRHGPNTMEYLSRDRTINSYDSVKLLVLGSGLVIPELFPLHIIFIVIESLKVKMKGNVKWDLGFG
jgi:hypothetical protein